jgi:hypothetical protein
MYLLPNYNQRQMILVLYKTSFLYQSTNQGFNVHIVSFELIRNQWSLNFHLRAHIVYSRVLYLCGIHLSFLNISKLTKSFSIFWQLILLLCFIHFELIFEYSFLNLDSCIALRQWSIFIAFLKCKDFQSLKCKDG